MGKISESLKRANEALASAKNSWRDEGLDAREQRVSEREQRVDQREADLASRLREIRRSEGRAVFRRAVSILATVLIALASSAVGYAAGSGIQTGGVAAGQNRTESSSQATGSSITTPPEPKVDLAAEVKGNWADLVSAASECDTASKDIASATTGSSSANEIYPMAIKAAKACQNSFGKLAGLRPPPSAHGEIAIAFKEALESCKAAYLAKISAFDSLAKTLNGNGRPSAVNTTNERINYAVNSQDSCVSSYIVAASKAGVSPESLNSGT